MPESIDPFRHLIMIGTPKSGTTSLFRYLSDHPQICPANRKETYFFARQFDYQRVCRLEPTRQAFDTYFSHCDDPGRLRLEATPYTLYARDAAQQIDALLPQAQALVILREPTARLFSDYRFHKERQHPAAAGSFAEFVRIQREMETGALPDLLELGCYADYLRPFYQIFGVERLIIIFFEDLASDPVGEMERLCRRINIRPDLYARYGFETHNQTVNARNPILHRVYMRMEPAAAQMRAALMRRPRWHHAFEIAVKRVKSFYRSLNNRPPEFKETLPPELAAELAEYYRPSVDALAELTGRPLPWKRLQAAYAAP
jgi:hypothetical protein